MKCNRARHLAAFYNTQAYSPTYQRRLLAFLKAEHPDLYSNVMKELARREDRKAPNGSNDREGDTDSGNQQAGTELRGI